MLHNLCFIFHKKLSTSKFYLFGVILFIKHVPKLKYQPSHIKVNLKDEALAALLKTQSVPRCKHFSSLL